MARRDELLYHIWKGMIYRCHQSKKWQPYYANYRGRGIEVCEEWRGSFELFKVWALVNGYESNLTLDREDNDGPYDQVNCRWVTRKVQQRNQRRSVMVVLGGESKPLMEWCLMYGVSYSMAYNRIIRWKLNPLDVFVNLGTRES